MAVYPKFVKVNRDDIGLAVRAGVHPMLEWIRSMTGCRILKIISMKIDMEIIIILHSARPI